MLVDVTPYLKEQVQRPIDPKTAKPPPAPRAANTPPPPPAPSPD